MHILRSEMYYSMLGGGNNGITDVYDMDGLISVNCAISTGKDEQGWSDWKKRVMEKRVDHSVRKTKSSDI